LTAAASPLCWTRGRREPATDLSPCALPSIYLPPIQDSAELKTEGFRPASIMVATFPSNSLEVRHTS